MWVNVVELGAQFAPGGMLEVAPLFFFAGLRRRGRRQGGRHRLHPDQDRWLTDILSRIADHKINRINELLPWAWAEARAEAASTLTAC